MNIRESLLKKRLDMNPQEEIKQSIKGIEPSYPETVGDYVAVSNPKFKYNDLGEIVDRYTDEYKSAIKLLTPEQLKQVIDYVNNGLFSKKTIKNTINRICDGWKNSPKTVDDRITRLVNMNRHGAVGAAKAKLMKENEKTLSEDQRIAAEPKHIKPIQTIENSTSMPGFQETFDQRLKRFRVQYEIEVADEMVLRLLVSNDVHLDNILSKQSRCFSNKRMLQCGSILEQSKLCLETLKLARRQRNQTKDEGSEKEAAVRFEQFQKSKDISIAVEEQEKIDSAKAGIAEFLSSKDVEDDDVEDDFDDENSNGE